MKEIIRLTESELYNLIGNSVKRCINENAYDETVMLNYIAQTILDGKTITCKKGKNDIIVELDDGSPVYVEFMLYSDPYINKGTRSYDYDVPDDSDEIIDNPYVEVEEIIAYSDEGSTQTRIIDDGTVANAIEENMEVDYYDDDIPYSYEKDYDDLDD